MTVANDMYDVAVVGAGPTGMTTALLLAKRGHRVLVLERHPEPFPLPRAVGYDGEAARTFQDLGIIDQMLKVSLPDTGGYYWRNADGELLLYVDITQMSPTGWSTLNIFSQPQLEQVLRDAMAASPLIEFRQGVEVTDIAEHDDAAELRVNSYPDADAELPPILARYVVGADGANSAVREVLGADHTDLGFFYDWLVIDIIPHVDIEWPDGGLQICDPAGPVSVIPGGPGRRRWEWMVMPDDDLDVVNTDEEAWRRVAEWGVTPENSTLERRAVYRFQARWANTWNRDRILIAGDAAHLMPPFAGQGMNSGLRDAVNLAWKLDLVLSGLSPRELLDTYTLERRRHVQYAIKYSIALGEIICIADPEEAAERDRRLRGFNGEADKVLPPLPDPTFEEGVVRRESDGATAAPAGHVAPQYAVRVDGAEPRRFDDVFGRPAALLTKVPACSLSDETRSILQVLDYPIVDVSGEPAEVADVTGGYAAELENLGVSAALVRPDGFYFGVARSDDDVDALVADYAAQLALRTPVEA